MLERAGERLLWPCKREVVHMCLGKAAREGAGAAFCSAVWSSGRERHLSEGRRL